MLQWKLEEEQLSATAVLRAYRSVRREGQKLRTKKGFWKKAYTVAWISTLWGRAETNTRMKKAARNGGAYSVMRRCAVYGFLKWWSRWSFARGVRRVSDLSHYGIEMSETGRNSVKKLQNAHLAHESKRHFATLAVCCCMKLEVIFFVLPSQDEALQTTAGKS